MPTLEPNDANDVRLTLEGDREAYGRLFDRHARAVRSVVAAVSGDFAVVEDLTQETFLRGFRRLSTLRDQAGFGPWIRGIARLVGREHRRNLVRKQPELEFGGVEIADQTPHEMDNNEEQREVFAAVADLPDKERLVLHAYFFHEESVEAAAKAIGLSRSGFYAALERGLNRLRQRLGVDKSSAEKVRTQP